MCVTNKSTNIKSGRDLPELLFRPGLKSLKPLGSLSHQPLFLHLCCVRGWCGLQEEMSCLLDKKMTRAKKENSVCQDICVPGGGTHQVSGRSELVMPKFPQTFAWIDVSRSLLWTSLYPLLSLGNKENLTDYLQI